MRCRVCGRQTDDLGTCVCVSRSVQVPYRDENYAERVMAPSDWRHLAEEQGSVCAEFALAGVQPALCYSMAVCAAHFGRLWLRWATKRSQYLTETFPWL